MVALSRSASRFMLPVLMFLGSTNVAAQSTPTAPSSSTKTPVRPSTSGDVPTIEFTHQGCNADVREQCRRSYALDLGAGEQFQIKIHGTPIRQFDYAVAGIPLSPASEGATTEAAETTTYVFPLQTHDSRYGGYVVTIRHKPDRTPQLPDALLVIAVRTTGWKVSAAGGFTASGLVNQVYALKDTTASIGGGSPQPVHQVVHRPDRQDKATAGLATFVHLSHTKVPWLGLSFALGIDRGSGIAYSLGPSFLFGSKGALTVGATLGNIKVLPPGLEANGLTTDPNVLTNLATKNVIRLFVGLSYGFLGSGTEALNKPFAGAPTSSSVEPVKQPGDSVSGQASTSPKAQLVVSRDSATTGDTLVFKVTITNAPQGMPRNGNNVVIHAEPASIFTSPPVGKTVADITPNVALVTIRARIDSASSTMRFFAVVDKLGNPPTDQLTSDKVMVKGP